MKCCDSGFSVGLIDDNDFFKWSVCFTGPEDTIYEGGFFKAILTFPPDFPQSPPEMKFITEMWHPNIYTQMVKYAYPFFITQEWISSTSRREQRRDGDLFLEWNKFWSQSFQC